MWLVYKIGYFQRSGHAIAYNSSKSSQILKQCDKKTRSTKAEVTGMPNSLINSGRSEIYSLLAKISRTFIRTEIVLLIVLSQILVTLTSHLINVIRCGRKKWLLCDWCLEAAARSRQFIRDRGQYRGRRGRNRGQGSENSASRLPRREAVHRGTTLLLCGQV